MTPQEREALWALAKNISEITGVVLGDKQEPFIKTRILRRMRELGLESFADYRAFVDKNSATETGILISALTTHHTYFFREIEHFDHMQETALPALVARLRSEKRRVLRIWSAAASYGHEAYSIAMFLDHHLKQLAPEMTFEIFGSDVSEEAVQVASDGVYKWQHLKEAPVAYTGGHWMKGTGKMDTFVKAKPSLRDRCEFKVVNLKTLSAESAQPKFDVIFCRNVFIYFTPEDIRAITQRLLSRLEPAGYLYLGASESLHGMDLPVRSHGHSVYTHKAFAAPKEKTAAAPIRVLCVDDSPSILTLLKKTFDGDEFTVVGTAGNGLEAHKFLQKNTVDLVTLDIHMPEMNGVEYIAKHYSAQHPPVIIVSSVVREDADLAAVAMKAGISDYVEKPSLQNFTLKRDELRAKGRAAVRARGAGKADLLGYTAPRKVVVRDSGNKLRIILAHARDADKIAALTRLSDGVLPTTVFLLEGGQHPAFDPGRISAGVFALPALSELKKVRQATCYVTLASFTRTGELLALVPRETVLLEEDASTKRLIDRVRDLAPYTSLIYESTKALEKIEVVPAAQDLGVVDAQLLVAPKAAAPRPAPTAPAAAPERSETHRLRAGERLVLLTEPLAKAVAFSLVREGADLGAAVGQLKSTLQKRKLLSTRLEAKYVVTRSEDEAPLAAALRKIGVDNVRGARTKTAECEVRVFPDSGRLQVAERGTPARIRVLMVEDSSTMRTILRRALAAETRLEVVGEVERPSQVAEAIRRLKPDVMTLDMQLPEMTGAQLLKTLPADLKIPTLVVSSLNPNESRDVLDALENGAFDFVQKPAQNDQREVWQMLCEKLVHASAGKTRVRKSVAAAAGVRLDARRPIIVGSSTGGTSAIKTMFETFPREIPPILITQHIPPHFSKAFAERLDGLFPFEVKEAVDGDAIKPNRVLIAPGGRHMTVAPDGATVRLNDAAPVNRHRPSCDVLFESAARAFGRNAMGVILTGMGSDGAKGLLAMRQAGAFTVGQNEETCVVYGMPKAAKAVGAVAEECALEVIIQKLVAAPSGKKAA